MDASIARGIKRREACTLVNLSRILALAAITLIAATGLLVVARRASGALSQPLSPAVMTALGLALAALALGFRRAVTSAPASGLARYALWAAPTLVLAIWAAGVTLAASPPLGLVALAGAFLVEEAYSWGRFRARGFGARVSESRTLQSSAVFDSEAVEIDTAIAIAAADDEAVTQHLVRRREPSGEVIEGWLRADLAAGQRYAAAHLAICPPLARLPQCFAEQMDGPEAQVTIGQALTYGVRFDIKLASAAEEPTSVAIEFSIQEPSAANT